MNQIPGGKTRKTYDKPVATDDTMQVQHERSYRNNVIHFRVVEYHVVYVPTRDMIMSGNEGTVIVDVAVRVATRVWHSLADAVYQQDGRDIIEAYCKAAYAYPVIHTEVVTTIK